MSKKNKLSQMNEFKCKQEIFYRCLTNGAYTEKEAAAVMEATKKIANYECFMALFDKVTNVFKDNSMR